MIKRKDGRFQKIVTIDGNRKDFYSSEPTEKKAEKDIDRQLLKYKAELHHKKHNFKLLADAMLEAKEQDVAYNTYQCYKYALEHLSPFFDNDIEEITPVMLQDLLDALGKKKYSYSAVHKTKVVFGLVIDYGIRSGLPLTNFTPSVKIPKSAKKPKRTTPDDYVIKAIKNSVDTSPLGLWCFTLLCTGLRPGELVALQVQDVDFEKNSISVYRSVEYIGNKPHLKDAPKSESGIRTIPLLAELRDILYEHCLNLDAEDFIFSGKEPMLKSTMYNEWDKYKKELSVELTQRQLRRAYAKLLYRSGIDVKTAQGLLGHASFQITMDVYTEFDKELTLASANKVNALMNKIL